MPNISDDAGAIRHHLTTAKTIAVVGHSQKPETDSYKIARFLREQGYKVYAVNPTVDEIDGEKSYRTLADIPERVDIVDVFRGARHLPRIMQESVEIGAKVVWGQFSVTHEDAAKIGDMADVDYVMDRCIKVEHRKLGLSS